MPYFHPGAQDREEDPPTYLADETELCHDLPGYQSQSNVDVGPAIKGHIYEPAVAFTLQGGVGTASAVVDVGDVITGTVHVSPHHDVEFHRAAIEVYGEEIVVRSKGYSDYFYRRVFTLARYDISNPHFPEDHAGRVMKKGLKYGFHFSLSIPEYISHNSCPCGHIDDRRHDKLPPSYGSSKEALERNNSDTSDGSARVVYKIRAQFFKPNPQSDSDVYFQASRNFVLRPSLYPAVDISDVMDHNDMPVRQSSYASRRRLSSSFLRGRSDLGTLEVSTGQKIDISLFNPTPTVLRLNVLFIPPPSKPSNPPIDITGLCYNINALTFSSKDAMVAAPTRTSIATRQDIKLNVDRIHFQKLTFAKPSWKVDADENGSIRYATNIVVPLTFPMNNPKVVQTYFSCLTSRQYEVDVSLCLGHGLGTLSLSIPINVLCSRSVYSSIPPSVNDPEEMPLQSAFSRASSVSSPLFSIPSYQESMGTSSADSASRGGASFSGAKRFISKTCEKAVHVI